MLKMLTAEGNAAYCAKGSQAAIGIIMAYLKGELVRWDLPAEKGDGGHSRKIAL